MTYITAAEGNLARTPELKHDAESGRAYTYATVLSSERVQDEAGAWSDGPVREYSLRIVGARAEHLVATAEREGNVRLSFAGIVTERPWSQGDKRGVNRNVRVITWGYAGTNITITREAGTTDEPTQDEIPF